jgi:hypothetical protein
MKGLTSALAILCFLSAMAVAKTGKFHVSALNVGAVGPAGQWHRPYSSRDQIADVSAATHGDR